MADALPEIEIKNDLVGTPQHINGTVATAGSPVSISPASGRIRSFMVYNPAKGPNANGADDVLLINIDGTSDDITVARSCRFIAKDVDLTSFEIDTNINGTNYEVILEYVVV